jgi:folate-binding protein YgfZ
MSNPLRQMQDQGGAEFVGFGPAAPGPAAVEMVQSFGEYEAEYAAIRKGVGLMHLPQRGLLRLTGEDCKDFLHRLTTQDIHGLRGGSTCRAMQLNQKGRIVADLTIHHGDIDTWLEGDTCDLPAMAAMLEGRVFTEDIVIKDITGERVALALHGPQTPALLRTLGGDAAVRPVEMPHTHHVIELSGHRLTAYRYDDCGDIGVHLWVPLAAAPEVYGALAQALGGLNPQVEGETRREITGRGIGWLAFNTARLEAGTPLFHIDFGPDCLPAETGILDQTVSFTKGCYLGQEIVGRMRSQGHPKRVLVGLRCPDSRLPISGSQVLDAGQVVGGVTSSAVSPLLGNVAIAFAMIKWGKHQAGTTVSVGAEGRMVTAAVQGLRFMRESDAPANIGQPKQ